MKHFTFFIFLLMLFVQSAQCQELLPRMDSGNEKFGFVDENGKWSIKAEYDYAMRFAGDYAVVAMDQEGDNGVERKFGFINKKGKRVVSPKYYKVGGFSEGCFRVQEKKGGNWSFLNKKGKKAFKSTFYYAGSFHNGMAVVAMKDEQQNTKFGYINKKGQIIVKPVYDYAYDFEDGYGKVVFGKELDKAKYGYVDEKGKMVVECEFDANGATFELNRLLTQKNSGR